ncbi:UNVERIFIED_CONTAM: hypothetical protein FKN15_068392, partial [Acipenser sinensis]
WLQKYGYLPPTDPRMSVLRSAQTMQSAIAAMQRLYGINITGTLDRNTIDWMKKPRCGVPDQFGGISRFNVRRKRYALTGQKWHHKHITYSIKNVTPKVGETETRKAIRRAFDVWQNVTPLTFQEVPYSELESGKRDVDITIIFASGFHGDSSPFDGPPDKIPQPTRPLPTIPPQRSNPTPDLRKTNRQPKLPRPPSHPGAKPDICDGNFNTLAILRREMFVFKDQWFWRVRNNRVMDGYPMQIAYFWRGLPSNIDAVYENSEGKFVFFKGNKFWVFKDTTIQPNYPQDLSMFGSGIPGQGIDTAVWWEDVGKTYFFKGDRMFAHPIAVKDTQVKTNYYGNKFWVFKDTTIQPNYPQDLSMFGSGIPGQGIDTAVWWEDVGKTYFFKGDRYWRYNEEVRAMDPGYPKPITVWKGIPDSPQGAFVDKENGFTYFYKEKEFWKFNNQKLRVEPGYPRSILKDFMGCDGSTDKEKESHHPQDDVDIVIKLDNTANTVKAIAIVIPCILALCLLVLVYTVFQFKRKGTPRHILYCKRSMQEWV